MQLWQTRCFPAGLILLLFAIMPASDNALAGSAISCHCFQDRTYKPAEPFAADDYILATSFNSLLSRSFDMPKRQIVMLKMKEGVGQNDLLVGLKIAKQTGVDLQQLLERRRGNKSWATILADLDQKETIHDDRILAAIGAGMSVEEAGGAIADEIIVNFYGVPAAAAQQLRAAGLDEKEMALIFVLAHARDLQPQELVTQHNREGKSWSGIAAGLGIEPAAAGKLILSYPARQVPE
jgi:hypothetical protein